MDRRDSTQRTEESNQLIVSYDALRGLAVSLEGQEIHTSTRKAAFSVEVDGEKLIFTPASTKEPRLEYRNSIEQVLVRFNQTRSLAPGNYQDITGNASYLLTLIELLLDDRASTT